MSDFPWAVLLIPACILYCVLWENFLNRKERKALKERPKYLVVTPEDIACGLRHSYRSCPVAIAMQRQFPEVSTPSVQKHWIQFWDSRGDLFRRMTNTAMCSFIKKFDAGEKVEPQVFKLPPLDLWEHIEEEKLARATGEYQDMRS